MRDAFGISRDQHIYKGLGSAWRAANGSRTAAETTKNAMTVSRTGLGRGAKARDSLVGQMASNPSMPRAMAPRLATRGQKNKAKNIANLQNWSGYDRFEQGARASGSNIFGVSKKFKETNPHFRSKKEMKAYLATIVPITTGKSLNQELLDAGLAVRYA